MFFFFFKPDVIYYFPSQFPNPSVATSSQCNSQNQCSASTLNSGSATNYSSTEPVDASNVVIDASSKPSENVGSPVYDSICVLPAMPDDIKETVVLKRPFVMDMILFCRAVQRVRSDPDL